MHPIIFSGIQPTGRLHLGNYVGAVKQWLKIQNETTSKLIISIVDSHAISTGLLPSEKLRHATRSMAATLIACGLDNRTLLFVQSAVPQHFELAWLCACSSTVAQLERQPQYKDKVALNFTRNNAPVALLTYPILQAADILLYRATHVPVGKDQRQHLELARDIARVLNLVAQRSKQSAFFVEPQQIYTEHNRIKSLRNPAMKMSKSDPDPKGCLYITDLPHDVVRKCKKALTDFKSQLTYQPDVRPAVSNLIDIHASFTGYTHNEILRDYAALTTFEYKLRIAEDFIRIFEPVRLRYEQLMHNDNEEIDTTLRLGNEKAKAIAFNNMKVIKSIYGLSHD